MDEKKHKKKKEKRESVVKILHIVKPKNRALLSDATLPPPLLTRTFQFSADKVEKLRQQVALLKKLLVEKNELISEGEKLLQQQQQQQQQPLLSSPSPWS
ncbi:hypothetical protein Glove_184g85 [Diversispora epigaea]|uniref:Uncharacterized protein n=1 Tax=Diversispora epigaea TaxID=1348612 RepID=A0A397IQY4_9GLOM|nr:hypothetical protein Glove_184g85 [Diversispora epigaea]